MNVENKEIENQITTYEYTNVNERFNIDVSIEIKKNTHLHVEYSKL